MKRQIIITDLTRFSTGNPNVCTAGIDTLTGECIRPMPYFKSSECQSLGILPGGILSGDFTYCAQRSGPHQEDANVKDWTFLGASSSEAFYGILENSQSVSIDEGFEISLPDGDRGVPHDHSVKRSIITIQAIPESIRIVEDSYTPGKIKLNFTESSGRGYRYFPITDLGFYDFAQKHRHDGELDKLNEWINAQDSVMLRIGLSRVFQPPGKKNAFWLQANGIYTFPQVPPGVRIHVR